MQVLQDRWDAWGGEACTDGIRRRAGYLMSIIFLGMYTRSSDSSPWTMC